MRILFISENYPPYIEGGAEISTSLVAKWLVRQKHDVSVATSRVTETSWIDEGVKVYPIIYKASVGNKSMFSAIRYAFAIFYAPIISTIKLLKFVKEFKPDAINIVVTVYYYIPIILLLKLFTRYPIFIDCRDYSLICPAQFRGNELEDPKKSRHGYRCLRGYRSTNRVLLLLAAPFAIYESLVFNLYKSLLSQLIKHSKDVTLVPNSRYVQDQLILNGFKREKTVMINNISQYFPGAGKIEKNIIPTFTYGGRIEKEKGIWDIVMASEILVSEIAQPFQIKIAGHGSEFAAVEKYLENKKGSTIELLGKLEPIRVLRLYAQSLAILAPSRWPEPFGRFILESISVGTPVITTRTGGSTESVREGITGVLVDIENPRQLANAIRSFIENPSQSVAMGTAMMKEYVHYEQDVIGNKRLKLYRGESRSQFN